ncbi:TPA: hypothetical protein IAA87_04660 [Candidatus Avigastranaerophilus faecigallinarum]|nr:hypothetical protein [Candidatus Avigastranaerophilus faecigallinarum]
MNILRKKIIILLLLVLINGRAFAANQANQTLSMGLPEVLEIEKIIVEDIEHEKNANLSNIKIERINKVYKDYYVLAMTPIKVKIHTNVSSPIIINAEFPSLKHSQNNYDFSEFSLSIFPESYTISNPYDHVITDVFTPFAVVRPDTVLGDYNGTLLFTLGVL